MNTIEDINLILCQHWDPTGLYRSMGITDEYTSYATKINHMLDKGSTNIEIAEYMRQIQVDQMSLEFTPDRVEEVLRRIRQD